VKSEKKISQQVKVPEGVRPLLERVGQAAHEAGLHVYAVGGCVRDWLLGIERVTDLDVVVEGDGIAFAKSVATMLGGDLVSHAQFGTATIMLPGQGASRRRASVLVIRLDMASCRKETYAKPAAYPKVQPGTMREDLLRRDFTINAMAMSLHPARFGALIDEFGGLSDLRRGVLRALHPKSFEDDPSRFFRAGRFATRFGFRLEAATARWLRAAIRDGMVDRLNRGRIRKELERIADEPDPLACLAWLTRWVNR